METSITIKRLENTTFPKNKLKTVHYIYSRIFKEKCKSTKNDHGYSFSINEIKGSFDFPPGQDPENIVFNLEGETKIFTKLKDLESHKRLFNLFKKVQQTLSPKDLQLGIE